MLLVPEQTFLIVASAFKPRDIPITYMRKIFFLVSIYAGVALLACQDQRDGQDNPLPNLEYFRNIGKQIPNETGVRWMELYQERAAKAGRLLDPAYSVSAANFHTMTGSVNGFTGIAFHHGLDENGVHHFILIPVDESLTLWSAVPGRVYFDANSDSQISAETARQWALNYEAAHSQDVWFHYFGRAIFDEIVNISYFENMQIEPALSDVDFTPQLLLIILNGEGVLNGRTEEDGGGVVYDASSPCPPCAVQ